MIRRFKVMGKDGFNFKSLYWPIAFINGLCFGCVVVRKISQYWEDGPMD